MPTDAALPKANEIQAAHEQGTVMPVDTEGREVREGGAILPNQGVVLAPRSLELIVQSLEYTPQVIKRMLYAGESGALGDQLRMYVKMIENDSHLGGVTETRSEKIEQSEYKLVTPEGLEEDQRAQQAVSYCQAVLGTLEGFKESLGMLNRGPVIGFQALEIEWQDTVPIVLHPVAETEWRWESGKGLCYRNKAGEWQLTPPDKFIINAPQGFSTNIARRGVMRRIAFPWVLKHYATTDWAIFVEIFGVPPRIAKYPTSWTAGDDKIEKVYDALVAMGADGVLAIPNSVEVDALGSSSGGRSGWSPHQQFIEWADRQMSKAVLGQTLTTDTSGSTGTYAAAKVHNEVRLDLAQSDGSRIGRVVRRDLLAPIVGYGLGWDWPVPRFEIGIEDPEEEGRQAEKLDVAVNKLGLPVAMSEGYRLLNIRPPELDPAGEPTETLMPGETQAQPMLPEFGKRPHGHALARRGVEGQVADANDELAANGAAKAGDGLDFMNEAVVALVAQNPNMSFEELSDRLLSIYATADPEPLAELLYQTMVAGDVNGRDEVDHEAGNPRPEEGGPS